MPEYEIHRLLAEANLHRLRAQYDDAIEVCMRVLRHAADNAAAHSLLGDIYRDQRSYREAMGWYKLAVQLNPSSQPDRRKLDEMIDLVFRGVSHADSERIPHLSPKPEPVVRPPRRPAGQSFRAWLLKVQPMHLVAACTVLCVGGVLAVALVSFAKERHAGTTRDLPPDAGESAHARGSAVISLTGEPIQITSPPPDTVESGTLLRLDARPVSAESEEASATTAAPVTVGPSETPGEIAPFQPSAYRARSGASAITREDEELRATLTAALKASRVSSTLNRLTIDPRTYHVTCDYTVPAMNDTRGVKEALLYTGLELVWVASQHDNDFRTFTLRGNVAGNPEPRLSVVADITAEQATLAYRTSDYRVVEDCLTDPWWHPDLAAVSFAAPLPR